MSTAPKRYRFDNEVPSFEPRPLPVRRPDTSVAEPDRWVPAGPNDQQPQQVIVQHIHQAQPDRTLQRLALGAGMGVGATAGAVYFGPLLIASLTTMAIIVLAGALAIAVLAWAIVHVVGGVRTEPKGKRRR